MQEIMLTMFARMCRLGTGKNQTDSKGSLFWDSASETVFGDGCKGELTSFPELPKPLLLSSSGFPVFIFFYIPRL